LCFWGEPLEEEKKREREAEGAARTGLVIVFQEVLDDV